MIVSIELAEIVALRTELDTLTAQLQAANVELTALREALRPFAAAAERYYQQDGWATMATIDEIELLTVGDLRRAAALTRTETTDG